MTDLVTEPPRTAAQIFTANVNILRVARGWTMTELGNKANPDSSSPGTWASQVESGKATSLLAVQLMADAFGLTPAEMISEIPCGWCSGNPPEGYSCLSCGAASPAEPALAGASAPK